MEIQKFERIPFTVDAVLVTEENMVQVAEWCSGEVHTIETAKQGERFIRVRVHRPLSERQTKAYVGDWVLFGGTGHKVYTPRAFEQSFRLPAEKRVKASD